MGWITEISGATEIPDVLKIKTNRLLDAIGTAEITVDNWYGAKNGEYKGKSFEPITICPQSSDANIRHIHYKGLYEFYKTVSDQPVDWNCNANDALYWIKVIGNIGLHVDILELFENLGAATYPYAMNEFADQTSGTIEFWLYIASDDTCDNKNTTEIRVSHGSTIGVWLVLGKNAVYDYNGVKLADITQAQWTHFRITFDCTTHLYQLYVNDTQVGTNKPFWSDEAHLNRLYLQGCNSTVIHHKYFDAVDYSWASGYYLNRNKEINYIIFQGRIEKIQFHAHEMNLMCVDFGKELTDNQLYDKKYLYEQGYIDTAGVDTVTSTITCEKTVGGAAFTWNTNQFADKFLTFTSSATPTSHDADANSVTNSLGEWFSFAETRIDDTAYYYTSKGSYVDAATANGYSILEFQGITYANLAQIQVYVRVDFKQDSYPSQISPALYIYNYTTAAWVKIKDLNYSDTNLICVTITTDIDHYNSDESVNLTNATIKIAIAGGVVLNSTYYYTMRYWYYAKLDLNGTAFINGVHEIWQNTATTLTLKYHHHPGTGEALGFPLIQTTGEYNTYFPIPAGTGNTMATYSFASDAVGANPAGWDVVEDTSATVNVIATLDSHDKVMDFYDPGGGYTLATQTFAAGAQTSGVIEFYFRSDTNYNCVLAVRDGATEGVSLWFRYEVGHLHLEAQNGAAFTNLANIAVDTWYHVRLFFDCATDKYDVWLDGVKLAQSDFNNVLASIDNIRFYWNGNAPSHFYVDAVDYSWDTATGDYQVPYFTNRNAHLARQCAFAPLSTNPLGDNGITEGSAFKIIERNSNIVANLVNLQGVNVNTGETTVSTGNYFSGVNCESRTSWDIALGLAKESNCRQWVDLNKKLHWQNTGDMPTGSAWTETGGDFLQHPMIIYSPEEYRSAVLVIGKNCTGDLQTGSVMNNVGRTEVIKNEAIITKEECNSFGLAYLAYCNRIDPTMNCTIADKYELDLGEKRLITCQTLTGEAMIVEGIQREYTAGESGNTIANIRLGNMPTNLSPQDKVMYYLGQVKKMQSQLNAYK